MKKISSTIALLSLCSRFAMTATQEPDKKLTKAAIENAVRELKCVELTLWEHPGVKAEGLSTMIRGDGTVVQSWKPHYPMSAEEKTTVRKFRLALTPDEVRKILRLVAVDEVLAMPKTRAELVGVREMRFAVSLSIAGAGSFEGEHPNLEWSKLPKSTAARELIQAVQTSVRQLYDRIVKEDEEFLSKDRLTRLIDGGTADLALAVQDIQGPWGGKSLRLRADGSVEGVALEPPGLREQGLQVRHFKGGVEKTRAAAILKGCVESGALDVKPEHRHGIPDEGHPALEIRATVDGATYARSVGMWEGQVRDHPAFGNVRKALLDLAAEQLKQAGK